MKKNILIFGLMILVVLSSAFAADVTADENELVINADIGGVSAGAILNNTHYTATSGLSGVAFYKAIKAFDPATVETEDLQVLTTALTNKEIGGLVYYSTLTAGSNYTLTSSNGSKLIKAGVEIPYTITVNDSAYTFGTSTPITVADHKFAQPIKISITQDDIDAAAQGVDYADTITVAFTTN